MTMPRGNDILRRLELQHLGLQQDRVEQVVDAHTGAWPTPARTALRRRIPRAGTFSATSSCLTRMGFASGLSILLIATTSGTLAAFACAIASLVCGITPSSAATTSTTMSVTFAPRARIAVKASWPGVSRNVITPLGVFDVIGADVLRDAARFAAGDARAADRVEERRLAVVDVTHDGDDRGPRRAPGGSPATPRGTDPDRRASRPVAL